eukprot:5728302-Pyramimonas_sp.AAC.1
MDGSEQDMRRALNQELNVHAPFCQLLPVIHIDLAEGERCPTLCCNPLALLYCLRGNINGGSGGILFSDMLERCLRRSNFNIFAH